MLKILQENEKDPVNTLQRTYDNDAGGEHFTCQDVLQKVMKHKIVRAKWCKTCNNNKSLAKCRKTCNKNSGCRGYYFNKDDNICTTYLKGLQNSSTRYCAKTSAILGAVYKYSCVYGNKWSPPKVQDYLKCKKKCKTTNACYGFAYDEKEKKCDRFMRKRAVPSKVRSNGVRCDNKLQMIGPTECPCFSSSNVNDVVSDLIQGEATAYLGKESCQINRQGLYGLYYRYDTLPSEDSLSLSVSGADNDGLGVCVKENDMQSITIEEKGLCLTLLQDACKTLEDRYVDLGRCPCYNADTLAVAVKNIQDGTKILVSGTCTSNPSGNSIDFFYKDPSNSWPAEGYSVYVSGISDLKMCIIDGDIAIRDIYEQSALDCFKLIQNACQKILET